MSLIGALRKDQYEDLRPHPDYRFTNGDRVVYNEMISNIVIREVFCELSYDLDMFSFILVNYTSDTFEDLLLDEEGEIVYNYLADIGIENIRHLYTEDTDDDDGLEDE